MVVAAATVVLVRDGERGLELLLLRRPSRGAFAGMWVFPGGKVDPGDIDPAALDDELAAARRAAVREAREETGLVVDPAGVVVHSHWTPPPEAPRRFSTWFFLSAVPEGEVVIDGGEIEDHVWVTPAEALTRRDAGEVELAPPTFVTLSWLAQSAAADDALARASAIADPERFATQIRDLDGALTAVWDGDTDYIGGALPQTGRHRLVMGAARWVYERSP